MLYNKIIRDFTSAAGTGFEATVAKLLGAGIFPAGLMLVVMCGAELFTGNNLMTLSVFKKEITVGAMLRNWGCGLGCQLDWCSFIGIFIVTKWSL